MDRDLEVKLDRLVTRVNELEKWSQPVIGRKVSVTYQPNFDKDFFKEGVLERLACRNNIYGVILCQSNSHGLCYQVQFHNSLGGLSEAWYAPEEVTPVP
jgi:hypothetical protein